MSSSEYVVRDATFFDTWRKSSYSGGSQGECLEVADGFPNVPVRDSKNPHGPALAFPAPAWTSFVAALKGGELS